jgi:predicted GIY-YIG superfamily endonuclease
MNSPGETWFLYILSCADGSLYTGIAKDVNRRFALHQRGMGAKYTRGRTPLKLVFVEPVGSHGEALSREYAVKSMTVKQKRALLEYYRKQQKDTAVRELS